MTLRRRVRSNRLVAALLLLVAGCATTPQFDVPTEPWADKDLGSFPYHPLVYHLDLSILAYHLYGQSLIWPFDPYYEEMEDERDAFMRKVQAWAQLQGAKQVQQAVGLDGYRGPGVLNGFPNNPRHDPIIYNYSRLHPWSSNVSAPEGRWTEYLTPAEITGRIRDVYVSYRPAGSPEGGLSLEKIAPRRADYGPDAADVLLAFEGGTGDKGEPNQPESQSLMGFVLLRHTPGGGYDVHITFRGSRSGSGARAMWQAFDTRDAGGNPDWITDMGSDRVRPGEGAEHITTTSAVSRGFARSMKSILPQVFNCLTEVARIEGGGAPENIYVTGHSLGGALAQHFVSAILLGDLYGPAGSGSAMPASLAGWPWQQIKLITYSAPRAGDKKWAKLLTETGLDSEFFATAFTPFDQNALVAGDPIIVARLLDANRPAGYRVLATSDPITSEKVPDGGKHVGKSVYVNKPSYSDSILPPDIGAHEPIRIREYMVTSLADPRTPPVAWRYREMTDLVPDFDPAERGSIAELEKFAEAIRSYYDNNGLWFDVSAFDRDLALRFAIYEED